MREASETGRELILLEEIERDPDTTQATLATTLGVAVDRYRTEPSRGQKNQIATATPSVVASVAWVVSGSRSISSSRISSRPVSLASRIVPFQNSATEL